MKQKLLFLCFLLLPWAGSAQISGPSTGTVGVPVTFSTPAGGAYYNWTFGTSHRNIDPATYNPFSVRLATLPGIVPSGMSMVFDGTNWYAFCVGFNNGQIIRASFGSDPTSVPTLTPLTTVATTSTASRTKSLGVVYDSTAGRWFAIVHVTDEAGFKLLDFGSAGLSNPAPTTTIIQTTPSVNQADGQLVVVRDNGQWHCVVSSYFASVGMTYYNFGASLGALSASTPVTRVALGGPSSTQFRLYKEDQEWFAIVTDMTSLRRYEFGTSLGNVPNIVVLPSHGGSLIRAITLVPGCDNQLYGYTLSSGLTVKKLNFSGSIKNNPTYTTLTTSGFTWASDPGSSVAPFVYNDTLFMAVCDFNSNGLHMNRLMPLVSSSTNYHNGAATHTFTMPGTYTVDLLLDPGHHRSSAHCAQITISTAAIPQPGVFTAATPAVCRGANNVAYTVPAVSGATSYEWLYTGSGATFSGGNSTTTPTNNVSFSGSATTGMVRVRAVNSGGNGPYRDTTVTVSAVPAQPGSFTTSTATVCQGVNNVTYSVPAVSGATTYEWSYTGSGATFSGGASTANPTNDVSFSGSATGGEVRVAARNSCGTSTVSAVTITVNPLPATPGTFTTAPASVCRQQSSVSYTVPPVSGVTYNWSYTGGTGVVINGSGNSVTLDFDAVATSGTVQVTTTNSCGTSTARTASVTVSPLPSATVSPAGPVDVCSGDSVTLTAGSGTGYTYQWKEGLMNIGSGGNIYVGYTTGNYKVVVTEGSTGCTDSTQAVEVTFYNRPSGVIIPGDTAFCEGGKVTLSVSSTDTGLDYRWKKETQTISLATADFLEITETGAYSVVLTLAQVPGCADTTPAATVTVHPLPAPGITWDGETLHTDDSYASYQWYTGSQAVAGATDATWQPTADGGYSVAVTDSNGCSSTSSVYQANNVGVADMHALATQVRIYPNPSNGIVHIVSPVSVSISVFSPEGKEMIRTAAASYIDLNGLAGGLYLLRIKDASGGLIKTEKLIKATSH